MDLIERLEILGREARHEQCDRSGAAREPRGDQGWIYPAVLPGGRTAPLLKVLLENRCSLDCGYCAQSRLCDQRDAGLEPGELARLFDDLVRAGRVQGLFLSTAIRGRPDRCMERLVETAERIRIHYGFPGYIHLKVLPGSSPDLAVRAARVADRLSINLEAPTADRLRAIAPAKAGLGRNGPIVARLAELVRRPDLRLASQSTQLVVGAGEETDRELVRVADLGYRRLGLARVYYSAFSPIPGTPLAGRAPCPPAREHRLYQADQLIRCYGFEADELVFGPGGELPLDRDPKTSWAVAHPERFPVEVNQAPRRALLRVPGIGPVVADRILARRREGTLSSLADLGLRGAPAARAAPHLLLNGRRPPAPPYQTSLSL